MPDLFSDKTAPIVRVTAEAGPEVQGCVVDASFARVHVKFEGPPSAVTRTIGAVLSEKRSGIYGDG